MVEHGLCNGPTVNKSSLYLISTDSLDILMDYKMQKKLATLRRDNFFGSSYS